MNICIFGDSITEGYYDEEKGGWVNRVKKKLNNDKIYNLGISGNTTQDLLKRFDSGILNKNPDIIIIAIGVNDSAILASKNNNWVAIDKFEENIVKLIKKSKKISKEIIFIGLTPCEEEKTSPIPWAPDVTYKNAFIKKYNDEIKEICKKENVKFIDLYDEMVKMDYKELLQDGLHPNANGHKWMAEKIIKELDF